MKEEPGANAKARRITGKMRAEWARELDEVGHLFCPMIGCFKKFVTVANFQTHYKWCTGKTDLQKCPYCDSLIITAQKSFYQHMEAYHPEKVEKHKKEKLIYDPEDDPSSSFVATDDDASLILHVEEVTESPIQLHRKRKVSLKENNQTVWKHKMKSINDAAIKNIDQFQKCVRFNSIVDKIKSVDEVVHTIEELQEATSIKTQRTYKKSKHIIPKNVIENELYFEDPDDFIDEPMMCSEVLQKSPKMGTKSVFVLDNEYYKRYHENLTMTRDWSSARKTYTRSRGSIGESKFCPQMLYDSSQDGQNINDLSSSGFQQVLESQHSDHSTSDPSLSSEDRLQLVENLEAKDLIMPLDPKNVDYNLDLIATEKASIELVINPDEAKKVNNYKETNKDDSKLANIKLEEQLAHQKWSNPVRSLSFDEADLESVEDLNQINTFRKKSFELRPIITYGERVVEEKVVTPRNTTVDFNNLLKTVKIENDNSSLASKNKSSLGLLKSTDKLKANRANLSPKKKASLSYYSTKHSKAKQFNKPKLNVLNLFSCKAAKMKMMNRNNKKVSYPKIRKVSKTVKQNMRKKFSKETKQVKLCSTNKTSKLPLRSKIVGNKVKLNFTKTRSESNSNTSITSKYKSFSEVSDFLYEQSAASYNKVISNVILDCETSLIDYQEMELSENLNNLESAATSKLSDDNKVCSALVPHEEIKTSRQNVNQVQNATNQNNICNEIIKEVQMISSAKVNVETIDPNQSESNYSDFTPKDNLYPEYNNNNAVNNLSSAKSKDIAEKNEVENDQFEKSVAINPSINKERVSEVNVIQEALPQLTKNLEKTENALIHPTDIEQETVVSSVSKNACDKSKKSELLSSKDDCLVIEKNENVSTTSGNGSLKNVSETDVSLSKKVNVEDVCVESEMLPTDASVPCLSDEHDSKNKVSVAEKVVDSEEIQTFIHNPNSLSSVTDKISKDNEISNKQDEISISIDSQTTLPPSLIVREKKIIETKLNEIICDTISSVDVSSSIESRMEKIIETVPVNSNYESDNNANLSISDVEGNKLTELRSSSTSDLSLAKDNTNADIVMTLTDKKDSKGENDVGEDSISKPNEIDTNLKVSEVELQVNNLAEHPISVSVSDTSITNITKDNINVEIGTPQMIKKRGRPKKVSKKIEIVNNLNVSVSELNEKESNERSSYIFCDLPLTKDNKSVEITPETASTRDNEKNVVKETFKENKAIDLSIVELEKGGTTGNTTSTLNNNSFLAENIVNVEISTPQVVKKRGRPKKVSNIVTNPESLSSKNSDIKSDSLLKKVGDLLSPNDSLTPSRKSVRIRSKKESEKIPDSSNAVLNAEKLELSEGKVIPSDLEGDKSEMKLEDPVGFINQNILSSKLESEKLANVKSKSKLDSISGALNTEKLELSEGKVSSDFKDNEGEIENNSIIYSNELMEKETTVISKHKKLRGRKSSSVIISDSADLESPNLHQSSEKSELSFTTEELPAKTNTPLKTPKKRGRPRKRPLEEPNADDDPLNNVPSNETEKLDSKNISLKRRGRPKKRKIGRPVSSFNETNAPERNDCSLINETMQFHDPNFRKSPRKGQPKKCARYAYINSTIENCDQIIEDSDLEEKTELLSKSLKKKGIKRKRESDLFSKPSEISIIEDDDEIFSLKPGRQLDANNKVIKVEITTYSDLVKNGSSSTSVSNFIRKQEYNLFQWFKPKKCLWKALSESEQVQYYPPMVKSMPLKPKESESEVELACFDSVTLVDKRDFVFFAGAPIWSSAWCPTPADKRAYQYLAIATSGSQTNHCSFTATNESKSLIQLWNMGYLQGFDLEQAPAMQLCLVFNYGNILDMAWCPNGCWEDPDKSNDMSRLGLLAVASSDALIRIYSIPHPNFANSDASNFPLYDVSPSAVLKPLYSASGSCTEKSACLSLNWEKTGKCDRIAAGYGNGTICIWMLNSSSTLLTGSNEKNVYLPYWLFQSHSTPVTAISFAPIMNSQWLVSTGFEKDVKFWDLNDTSMPVATVKDGYASNVQWGAQSCGAFVTNHETVSFRASHFSREYALENSVATFLDDCSITIKKSAFSEQMNAIAVSDENGEITAKYVHTIHSFYPNPKDKFPRRKTHAGKAVIPPLGCGDKTAEPFTNYQDFAVNTISWNPNRSSRFWLLAGGSSGIARLSCLHDLKIEDGNS